MPKKPTGKVGKDGLVPLTVRLKPETWKKLDAKARDGNSKNTWIQMLLDQYLDRVKMKLVEIGEEIESIHSRRPVASPRAKQAQ